MFRNLVSGVRALVLFGLTRCVCPACRWAIGLLVVNARCLAALGWAYVLLMALVGRAPVLPFIAQWRGWYILAQISYEAYLLSFISLKLVYSWLPVTNADSLEPRWTLLRAVASFCVLLPFSALTFVLVDGVVLQLRSLCCHRRPKQPAGKHR